LLNGVREVSKVDAAIDTDVVKPVDLREILSELSRPHAAVSLSMPEHPVVVAASADRVTQALGNILDNALSFSPPGGRVSISVHEDEYNGVIRVEDEGPGIPPEHMARVFDRFFTFRPDSAEDKRDHDGLGLAIARAVVDGYGGSIAATNLAPRGTRIEVRLPIV